MSKILVTLAAGVLLIAGSGTPTRAGPAEPPDTSSVGPFSVVAATFGAAGSEGLNSEYRCRGTVGQPVPAGFWDQSGKILYSGFWSILLERGFLPISVELAYFTADRSDDGVTLRWQVLEATDHAGFHVYRQFEGRERERITTSLLSGSTDYEYANTVQPGRPVQYWLAEISRIGTTTWFGPLEVSPGYTFPSAVTLAPAFPNPFATRTGISFSVPRDMWVRLDVYDIQGRQVATLANEHKPAGQYSLTWDGRGSNGNPLASGVYVIKLRAGTETRGQKLVFSN